MSRPRVGASGEASECGNKVRRANVLIVFLGNCGSILLSFRDMTTKRTTDVPTLGTNAYLAMKVGQLVSRISSLQRHFPLQDGQRTMSVINRLRRSVGHILLITGKANGLSSSSSSSSSIYWLKKKTRQSNMCNKTNRPG